MGVHLSETLPLQSIQVLVTISYTLHNDLPLQL
jgi:hypothetical protein